METPSISSIEVLHGIGGSLLSLLRIGAGPMSQIATGFEKAPPTNIEHLPKFAGTTGLTKLCSPSHLLSCSSRWWWVGVKQTALKKKSSRKLFLESCRSSCSLKRLSVEQRRKLWDDRRLGGPSVPCSSRSSQRSWWSQETVAKLK